MQNCANTSFQSCHATAQINDHLICGKRVLALGQDDAASQHDDASVDGILGFARLGGFCAVYQRNATTSQKSQYPARHIAFVHPAEASHGDLGMLTRDDVALVLSNSGETPELADVIAYTRRFGIPMIGVAGVADSTLIRQADVAILLPKAREVCPMGLAPTTSTTMTLALGDALAIALMEHRNFTAERYRDFHPGGKIGARLSKVGDLMHTDLPMVPMGTPMSDALLEISQKGFGVVGVAAENGNLVGIVTDGDLRRHMDGLLDLTVEKVMTGSPRTISPDALAEKAVALMNENEITCLLVVDADKSLRAGVV